MGPGDPTDFRHQAEQYSVREMERLGHLDVFASESSLCYPIGGDASHLLYKIALLPWVPILASLGMFLSGPVVAILVLTPWVDSSWWTWGYALGALVVGFIWTVKTVQNETVFKKTVSARLDSRLEELKQRSASLYQFAVEDPKTYQVHKTISEDYALGGLDRTRAGFLLGGIQYCYVIRPEDVTEVREDKSYLVITFNVGGAPLTIAVNFFFQDDEEEQRVRNAIRNALLATAPGGVR